MMGALQDGAPADNAWASLATPWRFRRWALAAADLKSYLSQRCNGDAATAEFSAVRANNRMFSATTKEMVSKTSTQSKSRIQRSPTCNQSALMTSADSVCSSTSDSFGRPNGHARMPSQCLPKVSEATSLHTCPLTWNGGGSQFTVTQSNFGPMSVLSTAILRATSRLAMLIVAGVWNNGCAMYHASMKPSVPSQRRVDTASPDGPDAWPL
mmetsp:Transcript_11283/g.30981  ORF Transcript_11283/g.30981 Transcript_11283/m.30981 type:complete len:211 (+) Transcript_11283:344-976(+)